MPQNLWQAECWSNHRRMHAGVLNHLLSPGIADKAIILEYWNLLNADSRVTDRGP